MVRVAKDDSREHRIDMEIVVDAYGEEERAMGWYNYTQPGFFHHVRIFHPVADENALRKEYVPLRADFFKTPRLASEIVLGWDHAV